MNGKSERKFYAEPAKLNGGWWDAYVMERLPEQIPCAVAHIRLAGEDIANSTAELLAASPELLRGLNKVKNCDFTDGRHQIKEMARKSIKRAFNEI